LNRDGTVSASLRPYRRAEGCEIDIPKCHPLHLIEPIR
jgi:hypothetical protein